MSPILRWSATGSRVGRHRRHRSLGLAAIARWSLPQKQPAECNDVFAWLRQQNLVTPALAESRVRAALSVDKPAPGARIHGRRAHFARAAALLQCPTCWRRPGGADRAGHSPRPIRGTDALAAGFEKLAHTDSTGASNLLPALLARDGSTPALQARLKRAAALGAAYDHDPRALAAFDA